MKLATVLIMGALCCGPLLAQAPPAANSTASRGSVPRTADGHPDLSGVWWKGGDVGGKGLVLGRGGTTFASLYMPEAQAKAKTLADKDDPALACVPTAFGTLNVSMFDVGAVAQIVQSPKFIVFLTETYHGFQLVPFDGRSHRDDVPPSYRGDAVGKWDGDTFVVDKTNFTDDTWISAEGRVSFHSDQLHMIERYTRTDAKTLEIDATLEDPKVLTKPWVVPKQTLTLAPFDQILDLACSGSASQELVDAAAKLKK